MGTKTEELSVLNELAPERIAELMRQEFGGSHAR